jgi:hypothetical protein
MAKRKGLLGMSSRRRKASLKMSANKSDRSGYTAPKKRTGANADSKSMAKATTKSRTAKKLSSFAKLKNAARQTALSAKGSVKAAGRKAKASVKKNTSSTSRLRLKKKASSTVKNKTANLSRRIGGMKNAAKLGFGAGKAGNNKGITTKSGAKTRANLTSKRSGLTQVGTIASLYGGNAVGKAARGLKRAGKMSAAHRKAISDGLKKRFGRK